MKLIDKDALVAEIERRHKELCERYDESCKDGAIPSVSAAASSITLHSLMSFINSLEVKEVDLEHLEQEVEDFCYRFDDRKDKWYDMTPHDKNLMVLPTFANFAMQLAKHFFELGLSVSNKAQKGV